MTTPSTSSGGPAAVDGPKSDQVLQSLVDLTSGATLLKAGRSVSDLERMALLFNTAAVS